MSAPAGTVPMIGRDTELGVLRDAFAAGRAGHPRVVVVRGEAGIGKSRLLAEFTAEAEAAGDGPPVVVAIGQCIDIGEIGAPFTPIRRFLREVHRGVGDEAFHAAIGNATVVATLRTLLPDLGDDAAPPASATADQVTEAIERVVENLSADHHLVLVIEDLHWADASTIALLKTLSVTLRGTHVTVVMTYRSDDVHRSHPLRPLLADLERNRAVATVDVRRLDAADTQRLARALGGDLDDEALAAVTTRSDGVPFFVEELADLHGAELPETLRGVVLARYERLSDDGKEVVGVVSVGGVHVDDDVLDEVFPRDRQTLREALHEALAANVLVADGEGYTFRHALIRESVHADLLPSERADLHRLYAEAMDRRIAAGERQRATEAAEHWLRARDITRAFDATLVARAHAEATYATVSAAQLGERLLELWPQVPDAQGRAGTRRHALSADVALEWRALADSSRQLRVARAGLSFAPDDDPAGRARLHTIIANALSVMTRHADAADALHAGLSLVEDRDDAASIGERSRLLGLLSTLPDAMVGGSEARVEYAHRAIEDAERSGDTESLAIVLMHSAFHAADHGDHPTVLAIARRITTLDVSPQTLLTAATLETDTLMHLGLFREAEITAEAAVATAAEVGLDRGLGSMVSANLAESLLAMGEAERAREVLARSIPLLAASPLFRSFALRLLTVSQLWDGHPEATAAVLHDEADFVVDVRREDPEEGMGWATIEAETALAETEAGGDPQRTVRAAAEAVAHALLLDESGQTSNPGISRRLLPAAARAVATASHVGTVPDETARLRAAIARADAQLPDDEPTNAYRSLVAAESRRGTAGAADAWREAVDALSGGAIPLRYHDYAAYRLAEALVAAGDRDEASVVLADLIVRAPGRGHSAVSGWARKLAHRAGIPLQREDAASGAEPAGRAESVGSLTPREQQVLALVAEGLTNPQIGARLFISPKTASVHVSAILTKIGAANRAEAAALYAATAAQ